MFDDVGVEQVLKVAQEVKVSVIDRLNFDKEVKQKVEKTSVFSRLNFGDKVKGMSYKEMTNRRFQEKEETKDRASRDVKMRYQGKGEFKGRGKENRSQDREQTLMVGSY